MGRIDFKARLFIDRPSEFRPLIYIQIVPVTAGVGSNIVTYIVSEYDELRITGILCLKLIFF